MAEESLKKQTKKGLYWKFAEQFSNYGVQFIIGIFMARLLSPSDYGITALPAVFMAVAGIFVNGGFGQALVRKPDLKEEDLSTAFIYSMVIGCLCYIILFFLSPLIAEFYNTPILKSLLRITALSFIYSPIATPQGVLLQRRLDFKTPAKVSVVVKILSGIIGIAMAFYGYGVWALVISGMFAGIVGQIITISIVRWYPKTGWSKDSFIYLWGFGNKIMGAWILSTIYENISPLIIGKYYSPKQLGVYNRAEGYANMASKNVTVTLQSVTFPVLSKIQGDQERLGSSYRKMLRVTAFVVFPMMMILSALARPLVITMITEKWESCIVLLQIMCFAMMWYPIHAINLNLLEVQGRSDLFLRLEIIKKIVGLIILCSTLPFGLVFFCYGRVLSSLISLFINTYYTGKLINCGFATQMKDMLHIIILSGVMYSVVVVMNTFIESYIWQIVIGLSIGALIYLGGAKLFDMKEVNDVQFMIWRKK